MSQTGLPVSVIGPASECPGEELNLQTPRSERGGFAGLPTGALRSINQPGWSRTTSLRLRKAMLFQLSYGLGRRIRPAGVEPASCSLGPSRSCPLSYGQVNPPGGTRTPVTALIRGPALPLSYGWPGSIRPGGLEPPTRRLEDGGSSIELRPAPDDFIPPTRKDSS